MRKSLLMAALVLGVGVLPLVYQPLRFEAHETHRAGLMAVAAVLAWAGIGFPLRLRTQHAASLRKNPYIGFLFSIALWSGVLILSTLCALSPARAFFGDTVRHMGLWTQLAILAAIGVGAQLGLAEIWRWFWLAGVVVGAHVLMQTLGWLPSLDHLRPPGLLGSPTFTGGWLSLAIIWTTLGVIANRPKRVTLFGIGIAAMGVALLVTGARSAALGLCMGLFTAALTWTAAHRQRKLTLLLACAPVVFIGLLLILSRVDWSNTPLSRLTLLTRLTENTADSSLVYREAVWSEARQVAQEWPILNSGEVDRLAVLRPLLGYGLENFEPPFRQVVGRFSLAYSIERPTDRAHNDWLDTLITSGWLGVIARVGLWGSAWLLGLQRLGLGGRGAWIALVLGAVAGAIVARENAWLPAAITLGSLAGGWMWIAGRVWHKVETAFDFNAWLALAVLTAYLVDLQFNFVNVATGWPAFLALGLLLTPLDLTPQPSLQNARGGERQEHLRGNRLSIIKAIVLRTRHEEGEKSGLEVGLWVGLGGALLFRSLTVSGIGWPERLAVLAFLVLAAWVVAVPHWWSWLGIGVLWAGGWIAAQGRTPEMMALGEVVLVVVGVGVYLCSSIQRTRHAVSLHMDRVFRPTPILLGVVLFTVLWLWGRDTAASIYFKQGLAMPNRPIDVRKLTSAAELRSWDDRFAGIVGQAALDVSENLTRDADGHLQEVAETYLTRALSLSPYHLDHHWNMMRLEYVLALKLEGERAVHLQNADREFAISAGLWPEDATVWAEWSRFALYLQGDAPAAHEYAQRALMLDPDNVVAETLASEALKAMDSP